MNISKIEKIPEAFSKFNKDLNQQINYKIDYSKAIALIFLTYFLKTNKEKIDSEITIKDAEEFFKNFTTGNEIIKYQRDIIYNFIKDTLKEVESESMKYFDDVSEEEAKYYLDNFNTVLEKPRELGFYRNDEYINKLAKGLLDINKDDQVGDFCAGFGDFSSYVVDSSENIVAYESKENLVAIGNIMFFINNINVKLVKKNLLENDDFHFSKIFCDLPISKEVDTSKINVLAPFFNGMEYDKTNVLPIGMLLFEKIYRSLNDEGTAVAFVANSFIVSPSFKKFWMFLFQKYDDCFINSIIQLPSNIIQGTSLPAIMIVLKKTKNEKIRMIDATKAFVSGRFRNKNDLSDNNINNILKAYKTENESSNVKLVDISVKTIKDEINNKTVINLSPFHWCNSLNDSKERKEYSLGDLCTIKRGIQLSKEKLNELCNVTPHIQSDNDTLVYYLPQTSLKENQISDDLPLINLGGINKKNNDYILQKNDIVLCSALSNPLKLAIIDEDEDRVIIASSNIYIIRINPFNTCFPDFRLKNPELLEAYAYYIKTCLETESTMNLIQTNNNSSLKIYVNTLEQIKIPYLSEEEVMDFFSKCKELRELSKKVKVLSKELHDKANNLELCGRYEGTENYSEKEQEDLKNV